MVPNIYLVATSPGRLLLSRLYIPVYEQWPQAPLEASSPCERTGFSSLDSSMQACASGEAGEWQRQLFFCFSLDGLRVGAEGPSTQYFNDQMRNRTRAIYHILLKYQHSIWTI